MMNRIILFILFLTVQANALDVLDHLIKMKQQPPPLIETVQERPEKIFSYDHVYYSSPNTTNNYKSTTKFRSTGMTHLYYLTDLFIGFMGKNQELPPGMLNVSNNFNKDNLGIDLKIPDTSEQLSFLIKHYGVILLVIVLAVLFIVIMPVVGLSFCCCRYVGRCGARSQPFDKRYDPCRRYVYGFSLSVVTLFILFGVVCAFTTNEYLEEGVQSFPEHIRVSLKDTDLYLNNTKEEVNTLFVDNFNELESTLSRILDASGKIVLDKLGHTSKAIALLNLTTIVEGLSTIHKDLENIERLTKTLQNNALQLAQGLKETRETLLQKMNQCGGELACQEFLKKFNIKDVALEANFSLLSNVTSALQNVSKIMASDIQEQVSVGRKEYEGVQSSIQTAVEDFIPPIKDKIRQAGEAVGNISVHINSILDKIEEHMYNITDGHIDSGEELIGRFSSYRYYACVVISSILCSVMVSLTIGLTCGFCGSRPNIGYPDECCNKGAGSRYLMLGVWAMFLSASLLMLISVFYFIAGITADKVICQTLRNPHDSYVFQIMEHHININKYYEQNGKFNRREPNKRVHLKDIIRSCHKNESLYNVLHLENHIVIKDVLKYQQTFDIENRVYELVNHIRLDQQLNIMTSRARHLLDSMAHSLSNINFPYYTHALDERITSIDLMQVAIGMNETAHSLPIRLSSIKHSLLNQAMYLKTHQDNLVSSMIDLSKKLESTAHQLQEHLKFNHTSLQNAIDQLLVDVEGAQKYLRLEGRATVQAIAKEFGGNISRLVNEYFNRVVTKMNTNVGQCAPLSEAYNATLVAGCNRILSPFNGFWMSVACTALLFIPAIIFAVLLSSLYQKTDSYPGPLVEAEYYYDIYGDHIPLNKPKWNVQASGRPRAVEPDLQNDLIAAAASSSSSTADRVANSEYERPPPYYYPKPAGAAAALRSPVSD